MPNPAALVVDYRQGAQNTTLTLPLDALRGLHVADEESARALENLRSNNTAVQPTIPLADANEPLTRDKIRAAQQKLASLGYEPGVADGVIGNRTTTAVSKFQTDNGLPVTGMLDADTLAKLAP